MPKITESALKKELGGGLSRVYFLYGEEDFLVKTYAEKIAAAAVGEERDMNFVKYADAPSADEVSDYLDSMPFLADYKCVLIEDLDFDSMNAAEQNSYLKLIANVPETSVLIIAQLHIDPVVYDPKKGKAKAKKLLAEAEKSGVSCEFRYLPAAKVCGLIIRRFERAGCSISEENAFHLAEECGNSLTVLGGEIDKLTAYRKGGEVTREDIAALVPKRVDAGIYTLADAIFAGETDRAYRILDELFLQGYEPHAVFSVLSGHITDLYRARLALDDGRNSAQAATALGYPPNRAFVLRNAFTKAAKLPRAYLADCIYIMYTTNKLLNSSRADSRELIEKSVAEISRLGK